MFGKTIDRSQYDRNADSTSLLLETVHRNMQSAPSP